MKSFLITMFLILLVILVMCIPSHAQSLQFTNPKFDVPIFLSDVAARSFDVTTTNHALKREGREALLPSAIVDHTAALVGFEAAIVGSKMFAQHEFIKHGHPRWARAIGIVDASVCTFTDIRNNRVAIKTYPPCVTIVNGECT